MDKTVFARWESARGKSWVELYEDEYGIGLRADRAGGYWGRMTREEAIQKMLRQVDIYQPDANKTPMRRVI